jgi:hypothetical protein
MQYLRFSLSLCAAAVATLLGCVGGADEAKNESSATACTVVPAGGAWWNQAFAEQTGLFHVEFSVTPSATNVDAVIGLSNGAATKWTSLAAIVRFNPQGKVDVRAGGEYRADRDYAYQAGSRYNLRVDVDVQARTYSVWINTWQDGPPVLAIARNYPFRTEQASVTRLDNVASFVNPATGSTTGSIDLCGFTATKDATTADGCVINVANAGFTNLAVGASSAVMSVSLHARAAQANMDGVVGVTSGAADAYDDFAASVRFWTNGLIEARDGATYRADRAVAYMPGADYDIRFIIDLASHTYSVYVRGANADPYGYDYVLLASNYKFRPAQAQVTSLDHVATIVASATGRLDACEVGGGPSPKLLAIRSGTFDVLPLADGTTLISNATSTSRLDANNAPTHSVAGGGQVAIDGAGSFYVASITNQTLTVRSFTPTFAPRWTVSYAVGEGSSIRDLVVTTTGQLALLVGHTYNLEYFAPLYLLRLGADGSYLASDALPASTHAVGLATTHYITATATEAGIELASHNYGAPTQWLRMTTLAGDFNVTRIAIASDGSFVFGGHLAGTVNFGDGEIMPYYTPEGLEDAYMAAFAPDFTLRFSRKMTTSVNGLATNGREIAVSYFTHTQLRYVNYLVYDTAGTWLRGSSEDGFVGWFGEPGEIALADNGRVYLNEYVSLDGPNDITHPFLATLKP